MNIPTTVTRYAPTGDSSAREICSKMIAIISRLFLAARSLVKISAAGFIPLVLANMPTIIGLSFGAGFPSLDSFSQGGYRAHSLCDYRANLLEAMHIFGHTA